LPGSALSPLHPAHPHRGTHTPETEEYGVGSFVYRFHDRPFHSARLQATLPKLFGHRDQEASAAASGEDDTGAPSHGSILRSKGSVWLATMHDIIVSWASAGQQLSLQPQQPWMCAVGKEQLEAMSQEEKDEMEEQLQCSAGREYGDREIEIVIIGIALDRPKIESMLNAALLTDEEFAQGPKVWADWECPFISSWVGNEEGGGDDDEDDEDDEEAEVPGVGGEEDEDEELDASGLPIAAQAASGDA